MKKIILFLFLVLKSCVPAMAQDTICITDKEYNNLLIKGQCKEVIAADSVLLNDRANTISLLYEDNQLQKQKNNNTNELLKLKQDALNAQIKKTTRIKIGALVIIIVEAIKDIFLLNHH